MTKITESHIEEMAINLLESQGFQYLYGTNIALEEDNPLNQFLKKFLENVNQSKKSSNCQ